MAVRADIIVERSNPFKKDIASLQPLYPEIEKSIVAVEDTLRLGYPLAASLPNPKVPDVFAAGADYLAGGSAGLARFTVMFYDPPGALLPKTVTMVRLIERTP